MTIQDLEKLMTEHGITVSAIPRIIKEVTDVRHKDKYPDGEIKYLEKHKREMLITKTVPKNAGKFYACKTNNHFIKTDTAYNSIEKAVQAFIDKHPKISY